MYEQKNVIDVFTYETGDRVPNGEDSDYSTMGEKHSPWRLPAPLRFLLRMRSICSAATQEMKA